MEKKGIDLEASPPLTPPTSSKTQKAPKMKASSSSKKTQSKNKKCSQLSKLPKPNLNHNTKDLVGLTSSIHGNPHQAQAAAAECEPDIAMPKISLPQQGLNHLRPLIPKEPVQMGHFECNMPPPQFENYAPNFNGQYNNSASSTASYYSNYAANYFSQPSTTSPYNFHNNSTFPASYYPNYRMAQGMRAPQTLTLFPGASVNNNTDALNEGFVKKTVDSGGVAVASNGEVDLELRL